MYQDDLRWYWMNDDHHRTNARNCTLLELGLFCNLQDTAYTQWFSTNLSIFYVSMPPWSIWCLIFVGITLIGLTICMVSETSNYFHFITFWRSSSSFILHNQCHCCWRHGDTRNQSLSSHSIASIILEYSCFSHRREMCVWKCLVQPILSCLGHSWLTGDAVSKFNFLSVWIAMGGQCDYLTFY